MRYDPNHKVETRRKVVAEAARAIRESGPDRVGVAEVMGAVGLTHGGFYAHFASKDELVVAAIDLMFADARGLFDRATEGFNPSQGLARYIDLYLSARHRDARGTGCPIAALSTDLARLSPAAQQRFGDGVAALSRRLEGLIQRIGLDDGERLASSTVAEMVGALSLSRAVADPIQSESILEASRASLKHRLSLETAS